MIGDRLGPIARRVLSPMTFESVASPAIADAQYETLATGQRLPLRHYARLTRMLAAAVMMDTRHDLARTWSGHVVRDAWVPMVVSLIALAGTNALLTTARKLDVEVVGWQAYVAALGPILIAKLFWMLPPSALQFAAGLRKRSSRATRPAIVVAAAVAALSIVGNLLVVPTLTWREFDTMFAAVPWGLSAFAFAAAGLWMGSRFHRRPTSPNTRRFLKAMAQHRRAKRAHRAG